VIGSYPKLSSILIIDSYAAFRILYQRFTPEVFKYSSQFLIVIPLYVTIDLQQMFADLWTLRIVNVVILLRQNFTDFAAYTYYPYQQNKCENVEPIMIEPNDFNCFPNKFANFYQCTVYVGTFENIPIMMFRLSRTKDNTILMSGIEGDLLNGLAADLNFKVVIKFPDDNEKWGTIGSNGKGTGAIKGVRIEPTDH
jgi:hypothetical protein